MKKMQLAKLTKITDLREVWKHEARDFSKWLSEEETLKELSDAVGINITLEELESAVGDFSADMLAFEEGTGRKIIIENQLTNTDHDHLGKAITYAAGRNADVIIWIVKSARDEHKQAVEWLNQRTDENVGFFLVEIELWRIGDSLPAPKFHVVERPNDWAKTMKAVEGLTEGRKLQLEFWQAFADYAFNNASFSSSFTRRKALAQSWYDLSLGSSDYRLSMNASVQKKRVSVALYIADNKELFEKFVSQKEDIAQFLDMELEWKEAKKDCTITNYANWDITQGSATWENAFNYLMETAVKFKQMVKKFDI